MFNKFLFANFSVATPVQTHFSRFYEKFLTTYI